MNVVEAHAERPQAEYEHESAPGWEHCPYCGAHLPEGFRFCGKCGRALAATLAPEPGDLVRPQVAHENTRIDRTPAQPERFSARPHRLGRRDRGCGCPGHLCNHGLLESACSKQVVGHDARCGRFIQRARQHRDARKVWIGDRGQSAISGQRGLVGSIVRVSKLSAIEQRQSAKLPLRVNLPFSFLIPRHLGIFTPHAWNAYVRS